MSAKPMMEVLLTKYGIKNVYVGHVRYSPDGAIEHECAVHVEYRDGRTICITDEVRYGWTKRCREGTELEDFKTAPDVIFEHDFEYEKKFEAMRKQLKRRAEMLESAFWIFFIMTNVGLAGVCVTLVLGWWKT